MLAAGASGLSQCNVRAHNRPMGGYSMRRLLALLAALALAATYSGVSAADAIPEDDEGHQHGTS